MNYCKLLISGMMVLVATTPLFASKLKTWHVNSASQFADARFENAVVSNQGAVRLARSIKPLADGKIDASQVWDTIEDREGNLIVAAGGEGKLLKLSPAGEVTLLHEHKSGPIFSLAALPDGSIVAGTGPDGLILHLSPKGEVKTLCETGENYIWSLVYQPQAQAIFAATGPKGRILKVSLEGKAETFYQTKQDHVLCLAAGNNGLYVGTDKQGLIYRIDAKGKGYVLFQAPQGEVRSLLVTPGAIYAGTSAPTKKRGSATASASSITLASIMKESPKEAEKATVQVSAATQPGSGENSVYRISTDGSVREIFREKAQMLSLLLVNGKMFVGTGMDGKLFEVDEATREFAEIARPDAGQIMKLLRRADGGIVLGTGDTGSLLTMLDGVAAKGSVLSEVFDAKLIAKWGALSWRAEVANGSSLSIALRGGNTSEPDATWSDWSAEMTDPVNATFAGTTCRFAQYRVTLKSDDGKTSPILYAVSLRYATANQAPEVTSIETPDVDAGPQKDPKKLKIKWTAIDPNEDELTFDLFIHKDGWADWVRIEEAFGKSEYEWDTTTTPSGIYRVKVVASDRPDNAEGSALTGSRESNPVLVAHEGPRVTIKLLAVEDGKAMFEATAIAPLARLSAASFSINGKRWESAFPTDGLFDGKEKTFRFSTEALGRGSNVMVMRVRDVAGNVGTADVMFSAAKK